MFVFILFALLSTATCQVYRGLPIDDHAMNFLVRVNAKFRGPGGGVSVSDGGGVIVSPKMILTAAHLTIKDQNPPFEVEVIAGTKNLTDTPVWGAQTHTVLNDRVHMFPRYRNPATMGFDERYDVALVVLAKPLNLGPMVKVAKMAQPPVSDQHQCWVMGWGHTSRMALGRNRQPVDRIDRSPRKAMIGKVRKLDDAECETAGGRFAGRYQRSHHMCFGCLPGELCAQPGKGDGGGPVVCEHEGVQYVVAVHAETCKPSEATCGPDNPSAGVRVTRALQEWMKFVAEWQEGEDRHEPPRYDWHTTGGRPGLRGNYRNEFCKQTN